MYSYDACQPNDITIAGFGGLAGSIIGKVLAKKYG